MTFSISTDSNDTDSILEKLNQFNHTIAGPYNNEPLTLTVRDESGTLIGGLIGRTYWEWLYIDTLIVEETFRGNGIGTELLAVAEAEAITRGCIAAHLDTHGFQAKEFYENAGYRVVGEISDLPRGFSKYQMVKELRK